MPSGGRRKPKNLRESTKEMFEDHKWIILIRENPEQEWRPFIHHLSGKIMKYKDLDLAIYALKHIQCSRYRSGNAKLSKLEDYLNALTS